MNDVATPGMLSTLNSFLYKLNPWCFRGFFVGAGKASSGAINQPDCLQAQQWISSREANPTPASPTSAENKALRASRKGLPVPPVIARYYEWALSSKNKIIRALLMARTLFPGEGSLLPSIGGSKPPRYDRPDNATVGFRNTARLFRLVSKRFSASF